MRLQDGRLHCNVFAYGSVLVLASVLLGTVITLAEPSIGVLRVLAAAQLVEPKRAPFLWALLNGWPTYLALAVGLGAGCAAGAGMLRIQYSVPLQPVLYGAAGVACALAFVVQSLSATTGDAEGLIGIAWDLGAVTAGPVTVPLLMALGAGVSRAERVGDSGGEGLGIVALASLFPVIMVLLLTIHFQLMVPEGEILAMAQHDMPPEEGKELSLSRASKVIT